jgi:hypothetical protein
MRCAQATASMPVGLRPPWVKISQRGRVRRPPRCRPALGVNRHHDALRTETPGGATHQFRVVYRRGVDTDLVRAGVEHRADILEAANATPTVRGMNTSRAIASTVCTVVSRSSWLAVISRKVISSAPCSL